MKRNKKATCGNCPYFDGSYTPEWGFHAPHNFGMCKRYAPRAMPESPEGVNPPYMTVSNWCGEHPDFGKQQGGTT